LKDFIAILGDKENTLYRTIRDKEMSEKEQALSPALQSMKLLNVRQVEIFLGVSKPTVYRLIYSKAIRTINIGRTVRIPEQSLIDFINNGGERHI